MLGWGILAIVAWIIIATWPARVASSKGHSFFGWFIISLFFWWITLFWAYLGLNDKTKSAKEIAADEAADKAAEKELEREESQA